MIDPHAAERKRQLDYLAATADARALQLVNLQQHVQRELYQARRAGREVLRLAAEPGWLDLAGIYDAHVATLEHVAELLAGERRRQVLAANPEYAAMLARMPELREKAIAKLYAPWPDNGAPERFGPPALRHTRRRPWWRWRWGS